MHERCPLCGTNGRVWNKKPEVFICPNCSSLFSEFGLVMEAQKEEPELWT